MAWTASFNVDACLNVFMTVAYDATVCGRFRAPKGRPGDYMVMRALMPQIVAISNCPVLSIPATISGSSR